MKFLAAQHSLMQHESGPIDDEKDAQRLHDQLVSQSLFTQMHDSRRRVGSAALGTLMLLTRADQAGRALAMGAISAVRCTTCNGCGSRGTSMRLLPMLHNSAHCSEVKRHECLWQTVIELGITQPSGAVAGETPWVAWPAITSGGVAAREGAKEANHLAAAARPVLACPRTAGSPSASAT